MNGSRTKNLPVIMYDQEHFTAIYYIDHDSVWVSDAAYRGMKSLTGYAPDGWLLYTQHSPKSFFFGAFKEEALKQESETGFQKFQQVDFRKSFEDDVAKALRKTQRLSEWYFTNFYNQEKVQLDKNPSGVARFFEEVKEVNDYIISRYLLTQPQWFWKFEQQFQQKTGRNTDLEAVASAGREMTWLSQLRLATLKSAQKKTKRLPVAVKQFGFLGWGLLGGEKVDEEFIAKTVQEFHSESGRKLNEELSELEELLVHVKERNRVLKRHSGEEVYQYADIMGHVSVLRFNLQTCTLSLLNYIEQFAMHLREKYALSENQIKSYEYSELLELVCSGKKISTETIKRRQKGYLKVLTSKGVEVFEGEKARRAISDLLEYREKAPTLVKELKGMSASWPDRSQPLVRGRVLVQTVAFGGEDQIKKLQEGDILVAPQTYPGLVPYMKKAKAILTDEGGITSHAAIVSRELGKPCIVGTKLATKWLRTGDEIEMDLKVGVVRKA